jgi:GST-like protein
MLYLAEHFDAENAFLPAAARPRAECLSWVMWLQGAAPYLGGGFGHFFSYAPHKDRCRCLPSRVAD